MERLPKALQIWLLLIPIFIATCLIYFLVLSPKARDIEKTKSAIHKVQMEIKAERQILASFEPLTDEERGRIKVAKRAISSSIDALSTINPVYDRLTHRARSCNIADISIDPTYTPPGERAEFMDTEATLGIDNYRSFIKLTFHSDFESLGCFLQDIEKKGNTLIASLTVTRELPKPKIELILKVFAKELR